MFSCQGLIQKIFQEGDTNFRHFSSVFFSTDLILSNLSTKTILEGSGGQLPRKVFEILHTAMAILVLFEQFLRKVCHIIGS